MLKKIFNKNKKFPEVEKLSPEILRYLAQKHQESISKIKNLTRK